MAATYGMYGHARSMYVCSLPQVLDVGCGQGTHTIFLGSKGLQATGVDLSPDAIAEAEGRLAAAGALLQMQACGLTVVGYSIC